MAKHLRPRDHFRIFQIMEKNPNITVNQLLARFPFERKAIAKPHCVIKSIIARKPFSYDDDELSDKEKEKIIEAIYNETKGHYEIDIDYIEDMCICYSSWSASKHDIAIDEKLHFEEIADQVKHLRSCTSNPDLYLGINKTSNDDRHLALLEIKNKDWRLDPKGWFHMCTPDLSDRNKFGPLVSLLIDHLKESDFLKHYNELKVAAYEFGDELDKAGNEISKSNALFRKTWQYLITNRPEHASRIPDDPEPDWEYFIPPGDQETNDSVIDELGIKDIHTSYIKFERILKDLSDDLGSKKITETIRQGHCEECPQA